jgi:hypothetical protein
MDVSIAHVTVASTESPLAPAPLERMRDHILPFSTNTKPTRSRCDDIEPSERLSERSRGNRPAYFARHRMTGVMSEADAALRRENEAG